MPEGPYRRSDGRRVWQVIAGAAAAHRLALACAFVFSLVVQSSIAHTSDQADAARELIHATSLVSILRTEAEQASQIADRLPEDVPKELNSQFRNAIDQNLAYDKMEAALIKSVAASVDLATLENSLRWWASDSGRAVTKAESSAYAEIFPGSTFRSYNPTPSDSRELSPTESKEVISNGRFPEFVGDLLAATETSRACLIPSSTLARIAREAHL
jgi:hypothetical protein